MTVARGGPQVIPRPPSWRPGGPAPWASLAVEDRIVTADALRRVFTGRRGAPSGVEASGAAAGSAVLAAFYTEADELWVVLTRRAWTLRAHTGEVSFPGGRLEAGEMPIDAALREAKEEIGLDPSTVEILGELDHLMTVSSAAFIVPHVALLPDGRPQLTPSPGEVDAVLHVPVAELLLDEVFREERWTFDVRPAWAPAWMSEHDGPLERSIFFFELDGDTLWGATAAMLRHLLGMALGLPVGIDHV